MAFKELKTNHQDRELFPYSEDVTPPEDGCVRHVRTQRHRRVACNRFAKNVAVSIPFYESTDDPVTDRYRSFYANIQRPWPGQRLTRNPDWTTESRDNGDSAQPDTGDTPVSPRAPATRSATLRAAAIRERLTAHRARRSADRSAATHCNCRASVFVFMADGQPVVTDWSRKNCWTITATRGSRHGVQVRFSVYSPNDTKSIPSRASLGRNRTT